MFLNHDPPPLILYYCIKSWQSVKEEADALRIKTIQSQPIPSKLKQLT